MHDRRVTSLHCAGSSRGEKGLRWRLARLGSARASALLCFVSSLLFSSAASLTTRVQTNSKQVSLMRGHSREEQTRDSSSGATREKRRRVNPRFILASDSLSLSLFLCTASFSNSHLSSCPLSMSSVLLATAFSRRAATSTPSRCAERSSPSTSRRTGVRRSLNSSNIAQGAQFTPAHAHSAALIASLAHHFRPSLPRLHSRIDRIVPQGEGGVGRRVRAHLRQLRPEPGQV